MTVKKTGVFVMCFFFAVWSEDMQEEVWELLHYKVNAVNLHQEACIKTLLH